MGAAVRPVRLLGPALLAAGAACLALGFAQGEAALSLFVIFPVITATGGWSALGIVLLIAGLFALVLTWPAMGTPEPLAAENLPRAEPPAPSSPPAPTRRWGGVVFLGPVPVVFGSDAKIAKWMIVVGVLLFIGLLVLTIISVWGI